MKKLGYIEIKSNKITFVYHESPEPNLDDYKYDGEFITEDYPMALKHYEASKQEVEIKNNILKKHGNYFIKLEYTIRLRNNMPCKAEIKDNLATIIKIL